MESVNRRTFLVGGAAAAMLNGISPKPTQASPAPVVDSPGATGSKPEFNSTVDFRYSPFDFQSTICFPDDPQKSVVGKWGELRRDFPANQFAGINQFGTVVEFTLAGMDRDVWKQQRLEAPGIPVIHTFIERPTATIELIAFASRRQGEGRVDNVLMLIHAHNQDVITTPMVRIRSCQSYSLKPTEGTVLEVLRGEEKQTWMYAIPLDNHATDRGWLNDQCGFLLTLEHGTATLNRPLRYFFRIPQTGNTSAIDTSVDPDALLDEVRTWWRNWRPFSSSVDWALNGPDGQFLTACARNIQQAREVKDGRLVFQVGPTVYRGLWIVDGNFILEAARYLGFDEDADQGLLSEWRRQVSTGQIIASGGKEHWKDTAIAIFTLVRACELKQDWQMLRNLAPDVGHAVEFLISLRDEARKGNSPNGRYGILAPGFPDGGIGGVCFDFTNTVWALAGLRALVNANDKLHLPDLDRAAPFYRELRAAFDGAARDQMVRDPRGFTYLPMLMREDPQMHLDEWDRPRPQSAQWALSQAIFPGEVFAKDDPVVQGHISLMQACTQEDVPAETGWLHHQAVWNYNAAFVAEVYLWAGMRAWAHRTFTGFLNHASPLYAWREEQPLQNSLLGDSWGDMPHNWASAECIRYLRHMLVLEDDQNLRLLAGLMPGDLKQRTPFSIGKSPTRFGRISLSLEPWGSRGWKAHFDRETAAPSPQKVELPFQLGVGLTLERIDGAGKKREADIVSIDPSATVWTAYWGS